MNLISLAQVTRAQDAPEQAQHDLMDTHRVELTAVLDGDEADLLDMDKIFAAQDAETDNSDYEGDESNSGAENDDARGSDNDIDEDGASDDDEGDELGLDDGDMSPYDSE